MIRRLCSVALLCLSPCVYAQDEAGHKYGRATPLPKSEGSIRVATYNVLNLFDGVDDPTLSGRYDDIDMATSDDRCKALAVAIKAINADVLCVEEIESQETLRWFRDTYLGGLGYDYLVSKDVGYYRGVEQGVLSRFPITAVTTWIDESLEDMATKKDGGKENGWTLCEGDQGVKFQRSPIMVDISIPVEGSKPYPLTVVVVHHKSGGGYNCQRESEALQIVELLSTRLTSEPLLNLIVLGDFNASHDAKSMKVYLDAGYQNAYSKKWQPDGKPWELFATHESGRHIDFIMLHPNAFSEAVDESFQILGTLYPAKSYNWRTDDPPPGYAADHYPLAVDLLPSDR